MTNSTERPIDYGQVSVFQSPHHPDVLLADIAKFDNYGHLEWCAIDHATNLYQCAIQDFRRGTLALTNYALFIEQPIIT